MKYLVWFLVCLPITAQTPGLNRLSQWGNNNYQDHQVLGDHLYGLVQSGVDVLDISNPEEPVRAAYIDLVNPGSTFHLIAQGNMIGVVTTNYGILIYDVTHPANPVRLHQFAGDVRYWDAEFYGQRLIAVNADAFLEVFDLSNPKQPTRLESTLLDFTPHKLVLKDHLLFLIDSDQTRIRSVQESPSHPLATLPLEDATSLAFFGPYLLAIAKHQANLGTQIYDLTDPTQPQWVAMVRQHRFINDIVMVGPYMYVTEYELGSSRTKLVILDYSKLTKPVVVDRIEVRAIMTDVVHHNNQLVISSGHHGLQIYDLADPASPVRVGGFDESGTMASARVEDDTLYLMTDSWTFQILDISDKSNPVLLKVEDTTDPPVATKTGGIDAIRDMAVFNQHVFVGKANGSQNGLYVYDVTNPYYSPRTAYAWVGGGLIRLVVDNHRAMALDDRYNLRAIDVSDTTKPKLMDDYYLSSGGIDLVYSNDTVWVTTQAGMLIAMDASNPAALKHLSSTPVANARGLHLKGDRVFVARGPDGFSIYDIKDAAAPVLLGTGAMKPHEITQVASYNQFIIAAGAGAHVGIFDVRDPENPGLVKSEELPFAMGPMETFDDYLAVPGTNPVKLNIYELFLEANTLAEAYPLWGSDSQVRFNGVTNPDITRYVDFMNTSNKR